MFFYENWSNHSDQITRSMLICMWESEVKHFLIARDKSAPTAPAVGADKQSAAAASPKSGSSGSTPVVGPRQQKPQTGRQARKKKKGGSKW